LNQKSKRGRSQKGVSHDILAFFWANPGINR